MLQEEEAHTRKQLDDDHAALQQEKAAYAVDLDDSLMGACMLYVILQPTPFLLSILAGRGGAHQEALAGGKHGCALYIYLILIL